VRLWSWPSRQPVGKPLEAGPDVVNAVAFSPDGRLVATADKGGSVIVWDGQRGDKLWEHEVHAELTAVTFSPDGRFVVTGGDDEVVKVWGVDDGKVHQELPGHRDTVTSVAFTPLGDLLATGRYSPDTKRVLDLAFNADGTQLATGGGEGVVRLWPTHELVTPETSAAQICTDVHDHVTEGALRKALKAKPQVCTDLTH
jgi:WD40 repeat protein